MTVWHIHIACWIETSTNRHSEYVMVFYIHQILEKKWEYSEAVHELIIDFKKAYDSVRREVMYNILIEFVIAMKLVRLIKMRVNETYISVKVGKHLCDMFPIRNGLKQEDALLPLLFNFAVEYGIRRFQINQDGLKLNGTCHLLVYADDVSILGRSAYTIEKNTEALLVPSKEIGLEVNSDKILSWSCLKIRIQD